MVCNSHSDQWKKANDMHRQLKLLEEVMEQERFCFFIKGWKMCPVRRGLNLSSLEKRRLWGYLTALYNFLRRGMEGHAGFFSLTSDRKQYKAAS